MRVLLDECLPKKLKNDLQGHDCRTVPEAGFAGRKNGELISLAERSGFEVFLTVDKGVEYQRNLAGTKIAILIVRAKSNRLKDLLPYAPACLAAMRSIRPGQLVRIGG